MIYNVRYTITAINDLKDIIHYIPHVLRNNVAASNISDLITSSIDKLNTMRERYPLDNRKESKHLGDRKMPIKNYIIFYNVDKINHTVWIIRIMNCLVNTNG